MLINMGDVRYGIREASPRQRVVGGRSPLEDDRIESLPRISDLSGLSQDLATIREEIETKVIAKRIQSRYHEPQAIAMSPDRKQIVIGGNKLFRVYEITQDKEIKELRNPRSSNQEISSKCLDWNKKDINQILSCHSSLPRVQIIDIERNSIQIFQNDHKSFSKKAEWCPNDPFMFVSASADGYIRLWDIRERNNSVIASLKSPNRSNPHSVSFSPNLAYTIATAYDDGDIKVQYIYIYIYNIDMGPT